MQWAFRIQKWRVALAALDPPRSTLGGSEAVQGQESMQLSFKLPHWRRNARGHTNAPAVKTKRSRSRFLGWRSFQANGQEGNAGAQLRETGTEKQRPDLCWQAVLPRVLARLWTAPACRTQHIAGRLDRPFCSKTAVTALSWSRIGHR